MMIIHLSILQTAMARPLVIRSAPPRRRNSTGNVGVRDYVVTRYMQRPPSIMPNYGKKKVDLCVPKTSLTRVLLYDNVTQQHMLDVKLAHIRIEQQRQANLLRLHQRAFTVQAEKRHPKRHKVDTAKPAAPKLPTIYRRRNPDTSSSESKAQSAVSALFRRCSTFSLKDVQLPLISNHNKQIVLKLKTNDGCRRVFHTYDENGLFMDVVPLQTFYPDIKDDPRFQNLETSLITPNSDVGAGFAILSPSYVKKYPDIPEFLLEEKNDVP